MTVPPVAVEILPNTSCNESVSATLIFAPLTEKLPAVIAVARFIVARVTPLTSLVALSPAPASAAPSREALVASFVTLKTYWPGSTPAEAPADQPLLSLETFAVRPENASVVLSALIEFCKSRSCFLIVSSPLSLVAPFAFWLSN